MRKPDGPLATVAMKKEQTFKGAEGLLSPKHLLVPALSRQDSNSHNKLILLFRNSKRRC